MLWFEIQSWASLAGAWHLKKIRHRRQVPKSISRFGDQAERLEDRHFLSAMTVAPEAREVAANLPQSEPVQDRKHGINLTGQWKIETTAGTINLDTVQHGKRIRGTADLGDVNVASLLNLNLPVQIPINVPPVDFKGTFKKGVLNINFESDINVPIIGTQLFKLTGNITAHFQFGTGLVGHLVLNVNGTQVLSTDFTTPLSTLGG